MTLATYTGNIPNRLTGADTFSSDVDYYHAYFTPFIAQFNADVAALNLNSVIDTSASSVLIGTGTKSFTVSLNKSFQAGQFLIFADSAAPSTNSMVVQVTSYNTSSGAIVVNSLSVYGSGTKTAWVISLTGAPAQLPSGQAGRAALDIKQQESVDYSFASGSLTLKLNPTNLDFRSTTTSSGVPVNIVAAGQLTTVISSGSTAGMVSGVSGDILLLAINNAGTMELAWSNTVNPFIFDETSLINTVAEGGAGAADSASTIYSTTARTGVAYRVVGLFRSTQTTAGTWAQTPTLVQGAGFATLGIFNKRSLVDIPLPAFSAYANTNQSVATSTFTKVQLQVKEYDTSNSFDNTSLYRFTPQVAGYYQVNGGTNYVLPAASMLCVLYKNGVIYKRGTQSGSAASAGYGSTVHSLIYLNGTSDYIELYTYQASGGTIGTLGTIDGTYFNGVLLKAG
jgi:hypothetical protein